ncbi:hypothetical protein [Pseudomonas sp. S35]|uniref:hypothetical protein n=1 Tax=Pseudomonas sp. S35 TaxID=1573719 RepID=UPI001356EDEB|nr:hypothetical protein [Pseudomonas sp. S35]
MSVNFPGGSHFPYSNIIPVTAEKRPQTKTEPQATPEQSRRWLEDMVSEKGDSKIANAGGHNALSMLKWMTSLQGK